MSNFPEKKSSLLMAKKDLSKENPISSRPNIDHLIKRIILEKRKENKKNLLFACAIFLIFGGLSIYTLSN